MQADSSQDEITKATAETQAEPATAAGDRTETVYVILQESVAEGWLIASESTQARSAETAVRAYVEGMKADKLSADGITCVAIPARSWKPVRIRPKVETTLVIEDA